MISPKDVVRLKVPYPNISSDLAVNAHMYICYNNDGKKDLVKAQTYKPLLEDVVASFIDSDNYDSNEHPFRRRTLIDLDKYFCCENVTIPLRLKASDNNGQVSGNIYNRIMSETNNLQTCNCEVISSDDLKSINHALS